MNARDEIVKRAEAATVHLPRKGDYVMVRRYGATRTGNAFGTVQVVYSGQGLCVHVLLERETKARLISGSDIVVLHRASRVAPQGGET